MLALRVARCVKPMDKTNHSDLERLAEAGDAEAQLALGRKFEGEGRQNLARGWYARAARSGNLAAIRSLAVNLLTRQPRIVGDGIGMIRAAADGGDAEACHICAVLAAQGANLAGDWKTALDYLLRAAELGLPLARAELSLLAGEASTQDDATLRANIDIRRWLASPPLNMVFHAPRIAVIEKFASPEFCDWLIERARPRLKRAEIYNDAAVGGRTADHRTNASAGFGIADQDLILVTLRARIAAVAGVSAAALESPSVLHYNPGEAFAPHHDFLNPTLPHLAREIAETGQRVATFLVYLNEGYEGGETQFSELDWHFKGRKGDALLVWNLDSAGAPDPRTRHAGQPPTAGEKWVLSQWIREEKKPTR